MLLETGFTLPAKTGRSCISMEWAILSWYLKVMKMLWIVSAKLSLKNSSVARGMALQGFGTQPLGSAKRYLKAINMQFACFLCPTESSSLGPKTRPLDCGSRDNCRKKSQMLMMISFDNLQKFQGLDLLRVQMTRLLSFGPLTANCFRFSEVTTVLFFQWQPWLQVKLYQLETTVVPKFGELMGLANRLFPCQEPFGVWPKTVWAI